MKDSTVRLRRPRPNDYLSIEAIAERYNDNPLIDKFETAAVVENSKEITAFGVTRTILEAILYCDGTNQEKVLSIKGLIQQAKNDAKSLGYEQVYMFVFDESFAKILMGRKFGFRRALGTPLIMDVNDGQ